MFEQNGQLESRLNDSFEENTELQKQITELKKELEVKNTSRVSILHYQDYGDILSWLEGSSLPTITPTITPWS
jgi:hypothetical protein